MSNQDNNNNNTVGNHSNDMYKDTELYEESNKRVRHDDSKEPESKRQRVDSSNNNDDVSNESSSVSSDSVSDNGELSETDRINTKYSKRFDAIEDYKEKNQLLSETPIRNVINKVDRGETLSEQEYETLKIANRLMDRDVYNDKNLAEDIILREDFTNIAQKELNDNNERIAYHEKRLSQYITRLNELKEEDNEMSSDNGSSDSSNKSNPNNDSNQNNSDNPSNSSNPSNPDVNHGDNSNQNNSDNPLNASNPDVNNGDDDDDGFDDFPPSFDFDDF
jgi:hypothetical protein